MNKNKKFTKKGQVCILSPSLNEFLRKTILSTIGGVYFLRQRDTKWTRVAKKLHPFISRRTLAQVNWQAGRHLTF